MIHDERDDWLGHSVSSSNSGNCHICSCSGEAIAIDNSIILYKYIYTCIYTCIVRLGDVVLKS